MHGLARQVRRGIETQGYARSGRQGRAVRVSSWTAMAGSARHGQEGIGMDKDTCELLEDLINSERRIYKAHLDGRRKLPLFRAEQARKRLLKHTKMILNDEEKE